MAHVRLTPEVTAVLKNSRIDGSRLILPAGQLERNLYEAVNKALVAAGGKWNRSQGAHVFPSDPSALLGLIETGAVIEDKKKTRQAFYTPHALAAQVVQIAVVSGQAVLEPSAGAGALVKECIAQGATSVDAVEFDAGEAAKLRSLHFSGLSVFEEDFLKFQPPVRWSRIVMNPPFAKGMDVRHVEHALRLLEPGGILVAVMPDSTHRPAFGRLVTGRFSVAITKVPAGAFKESGTNVATIILRIQTA